GLAARYACPALSPRAELAIRQIEELLAPGACLVGSSLGGYYATYLAERHGARAVLINPAITPHAGLRAYLGPQKNLHSGEPYELTEAHLEAWKRLYVPHITPQRYLLLVETGDEVLDYRQAVARYAGAEQVVIPGGDHSLQSFPQQLARILAFAGLRA
ncbi:MAG TPA: YqiA/YcfP family alpha/beta fold hydrolase, partial [Burkholderiales bacterium]|nr:YqiA/YcfP family alpha/beta fold hydrolase [Burkholderiales bacterium]